MSASPGQPMKQLALDIGLAPLPTLDNFVGVGNEAALAHLRLWVPNPLRSPVPTFLWGESGSGKTHLLRAVREALREQGSRVGWMDASTLDPAEYDEHWDLRVWVEVPVEVALQRGIARDSDMEGGAAAAERLHRDRYQASEEIYIREVDPVARADIVVDNTDVERPTVIRW